MEGPSTKKKLEASYSAVATAHSPQVSKHVAPGPLGLVSPCMQRTLIF